MNKKLRALISGLIIISQVILATPTLAANFSDVFENNRNYKAISFLQENGVISGYKDGSFRPNQKVNRVEFLKIVLEASSINLDAKEPTDFKDVNESAWYAPYLKKAKKEGWITGYEDGTFKPAQNINKAEALKIIALTQNWKLKTKEEITEKPYEDTETSDWFISYIEFAKSQEIISKNNKKILPSQKLTRADVAELLYKTIENKVANFTPKNTQETSKNSDDTTESQEDINLNETKPTEQITQNLDFKPVTYKSLSKGSFYQIELDEKFPNTFYENEIYIFTGKLTTPGPDAVLAFLTKKDDKEKVTTNFKGKANQDGNFTVSVAFKKSGNYQIGMIPGIQGSSKVIDISVLPSLPKAKTKIENKAPINPAITFSNDSTKFNWDKNENQVFRVNIWQNSKIVSYFNRQDETTINAIYQDFKDFKKGQANLEIQGAKAASTMPLELSSEWKNSKQISFEITEHSQSNINLSEISLIGLKEIMSGPKKISFSGTFKIPCISEAAVIRPDGLIDTVKLESKSATSKHYSYNVYPANAKFTFEYTPKQSGTHIIEINKQNGAATVNTPIYIGTAMPLIPDYFDLANNKLSDEPINLKSARNELLNYINQARSKQKLEMVILDEDLNTLAQLHSKDMAENNYFSHINLEGQSPTERRKELEIPTEVGENLGKAPNVRYGHEGLMRSAIHRENILDPSWSKVGLGIQKDKAGYVYITEEFSHDPYTSSLISKFEDETLKAINETRNSKSLKSVVKNITLDRIAEVFTQDLLNGKSITSASIRDQFLLNNLKYKTAFLLNGTSPNNTKIIEESTKQIDATHGQWNEVGIKYKIDAFGTLVFVILYTN